MANSDMYSMFPCDPYRNVSWRKLQELDGCIEESSFGEETVIKVDPLALERLALEAFHDIAHFLRPDT